MQKKRTSVECFSQRVLLQVTDRLNGFFLIEPDAGPNGGFMRVLVVEDDNSIRETLGMVLESYGHKADLVGSGEIAIEYLKNIWPDVMLLDLTLQGMSGEEVYFEIRSRFGRVPPTVVLSAAQQGEHRARHLPGASFLSKPYTLEELADIIEQAAAARGAA